MKKLMIAAAIVCAAALSQAATANWTYQTTVTIKDGTGASATAVADNLAVYVFDGGLTSAKAVYDAWAADGSISTVGLIDQTTTSSGKFTLANVGYGEQSVSGGTSNYYDFFFVVDGGDQIFLSTAKTHQKANTSASVKSISWTSIGDSASLPVTGGVAGAWNNVPEPTSGLLLLLGVAGLALRRRRA